MIENTNAGELGYLLTILLQQNDAGFVIDMGCSAKITQVHLRNSHNDGSNDR